jgi:hypothetical protein
MHRTKPCRQNSGTIPESAEPNEDTLTANTRFCACDHHGRSPKDPEAGNKPHSKTRDPLSLQIPFHVFFSSAYSGFASVFTRSVTSSLKPSGSASVIAPA